MNGKSEHETDHEWLVRQVRVAWQAERDAGGSPPSGEYALVLEELPVARLRKMLGDSRKRIQERSQ